MCLPCDDDQPASAGPRGFDGRARRVAVIDIDVHHGDGSEEILRHLAPRLPPGALFFASIHLFDPGDATFGQFFPGSGAADAMQVNSINVPITPMWRRNKTDKAAHVHHSKGGGAGSGSPRSPAFGSGRSEWRAAFAQRVLPALRAFCPDLERLLRVCVATPEQRQRRVGAAPGSDVPRRSSAGEHRCTASSRLCRNCTYTQPR